MALSWRNFKYSKVYTPMQLWNKKIGVVKPDFSRYYLYLFQSLPSGKIVIYDKKHMPIRNVKAYGFKRINNLLCYFSSKALEPLEIEKLTGENKWKLINLNLGKSYNYKFDHSFFLWILNIKKIEDYSYKNNNNFINRLLDIYESPLPAKKTFPDPELYYASRWIKKNPICILPDCQVIDMHCLVKAIVKRVGEESELLWYTSGLAPENRTLS